MKRVGGIVVAFAALSLILAARANAAGEFKLSHSQSIACGRDHNSGRLSTATCRSYAYLFNSRTSEYFRCTVSVAMTRNNKEVLSVQSDGGCVRKPRIFATDGDYSFDAAETGPPNTNAIFGQGGYAIWASDNAAKRVRGCITISSGLGSDVSKCVDMAFH